jgi:hypothetical protein
MSQEERSSGRAPARVKPALSIRARVLVLVALAIAPLLFDRIRLLHTERADRIAAASEEAISLAHRGIEAQQEIVLAARSVLQVIARGYAVGSPQSCDRFIAQVGADVPWMKSLLIIGLDGRISCSNFPNTVGLDLSDRAYFQQALRTGDFVLSDYLFGRLQQAPTIVAALPLRGPDATVAGVIATGIDLEWIGRLGDAVTGRKGMSALLIDGKGVVLARHPGGEEFALLLPDTHVRIAIETAEQLRRKVEELHIAHAEAPTGFVTISVGIASLEPKRHQDSQVLVQAADAALYAAKRRGRNLVVAECPDAVALAS